MILVFRSAKKTLQLTEEITISGLAQCTLVLEVFVNFSLKSKMALEKRRSKLLSIIYPLFLAITKILSSEVKERSLELTQKRWKI